MMVLLHQAKIPAGASALHGTGSILEGNIRLYFPL